MRGSEENVSGTRPKLNVLTIAARSFLREEGRLTSEDFRAQLQSRGVIAALESKALWNGDGPRQRSKTRRGFTFGDLWSFYCSCASGRARAAENIRLNRREKPAKRAKRSSKEATRAAAAIRAGVAAMRRMRDAFPPPWGVDEMPECGDQMTVYRVPTIVGRVDDERYPDSDTIIALLNYAEDLEHRAAALPKNRRAVTSQQTFVRRWATFSAERSDEYLDAIGAQLFAIAYGEDIDADAYAQRRKRLARLSGRTKARKK